VVDLYEHNRRAWDDSVEHQSEWTLPASPKTIAAARRGDWQIKLTRSRPVPRDWFPDLPGLDVLCLASGGGQQAPVLAAAGAQVTVLDISPRQLAQDRLVALREGLAITTVEGNMADLSMFAGASFDLIVHPVSNLFVPDIHPVWAEAFRVLRSGGILLAAFMNPVFYLFDRDQMDSQGVLEVKNRLPYSDLADGDRETLECWIDEGWPLEFSHSLEDQVAGQLEAGFVITGFYEDRDSRVILDRYMPIHIATRAIKP